MYLKTYINIYVYEFFKKRNKIDFARDKIENII